MHKIQSKIDAGLQILELEITTKCNLNCKHCYVDKRQVFELNKEKVEIIIKEASELGVYRLVFTGGEPLLVQEIFEYAKFAKKFGILQVVLMTNGTLINEKNIKNLNIFDLVQLSLDVPPGKTPHFRDNYTEKLIETIELLKSNGIQVSLQVTLHKSLVPLLDEISEFSNKYGVRVGINRLNAVGGGKNLQNEILSPSELKFALNKIAKLKFENTNIGCSDPLLFLVEKKRMQLFKDQPQKVIVGGCLAGVAALYIAANLDVFICPFVRLKIDSIRKNSLSKIWFSNRQLARLRQRDFLGKCGSCEYTSFCGGCRASSFVNTGSLFGSDICCFK